MKKWTMNRFHLPWILRKRIKVNYFQKKLQCLRMWFLNMFLKPQIKSKNLIKKRKATIKKSLFQNWKWMTSIYQMMMNWNLNSCHQPWIPRRRIKVNSFRKKLRCLQLWFLGNFNRRHYQASRKRSDKENL